MALFVFYLSNVTKLASATTYVHEVCYKTAIGNECSTLSVTVCVYMYMELCGTIRV